MELGGRVSGYRGVAIRCPGCGEPMVEDSVADAVVDVCASCGGIWLDWFDGETSALAVSILENERTRGAAHPRRIPAAGQPEATKLGSETKATGACPRCTRHLVPERYVVVTMEGGQRTERATGAELVRCEDCAGVFLTRTSAELIVAIANEEVARSDEAPPNVEAAFWARIVAVVKAIFGAR